LLALSKYLEHTPIALTHRTHSRHTHPRSAHRTQSLAERNQVLSPHLLSCSLTIVDHELANPPPLACSITLSHSVHRGQSATFSLSQISCHNQSRSLSHAVCGNQCRRQSLAMASYISQSVYHAHAHAVAPTLSLSRTLSLPLTIIPLRVVLTSIST